MLVCPFCDGCNEEADWHGNAVDCTGSIIRYLKGRS